MKCTMSLVEALHILNIFSNPVTKDLIKTNYRRLANKYHPDRNPNGLKMMQDINISYQYLSTLNEAQLYFEEEEEEINEPDEYHLFRTYGLRVYEDEYKTWIKGKTYHYKNELKKYKFRWDPDEKAWWRTIKK